MKKETRTFPLNNLVSIEIDRENGVAIGIYEEKKPAYKVGGWYKSNHTSEVALVLDDEFHHVSFQDDEFVEMQELVRLPSNKLAQWQPADMKEVERLLIGEAEKNYPKGVRYRTNLNSEFVSDGTYRYHAGIGIASFYGGGLFFNEEAGKWADIIEEKNPLYCVHKESLEILEFKGQFPRYMEPRHYSKAMTERECHQYLADNWDELNKNK